MSTILNIQNLVVRFKLTKTVQIHAVNDVSVSLKEKETVGIVGESGCGKSTIGKILIGLINQKEKDNFGINELSGFLNHKIIY